MRRARALAAAWLVACGTVQAASIGASSTRFCDRSEAFTASQQDRLLRFAAVVRDELEAAQRAGGAALISRSGLDLSRFRIRYSHAAIAWRGDDGAWSGRQLYYACDERRPRIYDQGLAGFVMGVDDPSLGYVSIVTLPDEAARALRSAALDAPRALHLVAARYSANAYAFGLSRQNCNQWLAEMLAVAWGGLDDGDALRPRAQAWLRRERYEPEPVEVGSHALMFAAHFVPLLSLDDHPEDDRFALKLRVSLPASLEAFVRQRFDRAERVELCHDGQRIVVHRGWEPVAAGCVPGEGDRVIPFD